MREIIKLFILQEDGASAVEYAVLVGAIGVVLIAAITGFYNTLSSKIDEAAQKIGTK